MPKKEKLEGGYCIMVQRDNLGYLAMKKRNSINLVFVRTVRFMNVSLLKSINNLEKDIFRLTNHRFQQLKV